MLPLLSCLLFPSPGLTAAPLIALDVGHTLAEPGAISARGMPEFSFNLALAQTIHAELTEKKQQSLLIGADGDLRELKSRTREAQALGATFFLSIHHDSADERYLETWEWAGASHRFTGRLSGFSLFVSRRNPAPQRSLRCASALGAALRQHGFMPTPHHAEKHEWADQTNGVYYYDNLVVLHTAASPAVLFEAGVILNPAEELRLQAPETRQSIAQALYDGLKGCGALDPKRKRTAWRPLTTPRLPP